MGDRIIQRLDLDGEAYFLIECEIYRSVGGKLTDTLVYYTLAKAVMVTPTNIKEKNISSEQTMTEGT